MQANKQAPFAFDCEPGPGDGLCLNRSLRHISHGNHIQHLVSWLGRRGLVLARDWVRRYSVVPVQEVAWESEAAGIDWRRGVRNPGGLIHRMIQKRWQELGEQQ